MTIYMGPGNDHWRREMSKLPLPFPELAEGMYIASSNAELDNITRYELLEKESFTSLQCSCVGRSNLVITGNTCVYDWRCVLKLPGDGKRCRKSLVQIQGDSTHP